MDEGLLVKWQQMWKLDEMAEEVWGLEESNLEFREFLR